ncbi:MAG: hypothetical protein NZM02_00385 [Patescibacteria group bacterium]|nr:hypothetical protein [Patescibacteria group bacterium]
MEKTKESFLNRSKVFEFLGLKEDLKIPENIANFIYQRVFDRGLARSIKQIDSDENIDDFDLSEGPPLFVFASWTEKYLRKGGFDKEIVFDISNVFEANQAGQIFGDRLIYDVCSVVFSSFSNKSDFVLVRVGGDEFKVLFKDQNIDSDDLKLTIQQAVSDVSYITIENGSQKTKKQASVSFKKGKQFLNRQKNQEEIDLEERVKKLKQKKPSLFENLNTNNPLLIEILEDILFDPLIEKVVQAKTREKEGLLVEVFNDYEDLLEHLDPGDFSLLKFEFPGLLKLVNDKFGYDEGDKLIEYLFSFLVDFLYEKQIRQFKVLRRGGDFFIITNKIEEDKAQEMIAKQDKPLARYKLEDRELPIIILPTLTGFHIADDNIESKKESFYKAIERASSQVLENLKTLISNFIQRKRDLTDDDWWYLAYILNPFDKRGFLRLTKLDLADFVEILKSCFDNYQKQNYELGNYQGQIDLFKRIINYIVFNVFKNN